jgi:hypothetical protein
VCLANTHGRFENTGNVQPDESKVTEGTAKSYKHFAAGIPEVV